MNAPEALSLVGLHRDMPAETYHAIHAMSAGGLTRMKQSPAHFYGIQLDPSRPQSGEPTAAMANGTLVHCAIFEPDALARRYQVAPADAPRKPTDVQRRAAKPSPETLAAIAWWDAFAARSKGAQIVDAADMAAAQAQARAVRALPDIAALLSEGYGESSAFWIDQQTDELCKCRPDWVSPAGDGVILIDGKTCRDASPDGFGRAVYTMDYHLQAAWYSGGFEHATGMHVHGFVFAAVENTWPHIAAAYMLGDDVLEAARRENRRLLNRYAECKRTGVWPGYAAGVNLINLPKWAQLENE